MREFIRRAAMRLGVTVEFSGEGDQEIGTVTRVEEVAAKSLAKCKRGDVIVRVDLRYYRPTEVETLLGDPTKAREKLGWTPRTTFEELVNEMVDADFDSARRDHMVKAAGFKIYHHHE